MLTTPDILLLGATGFTGRLILQYLTTHPEKSAFNLTLGARSKSRLDALLSEFNLSAVVRLVVVDIANQDEIDAAVSAATVVINTIGPHWTWGTPVVKACVERGVHCVDLSGETEWIKRIITTFHLAATKSGAVIVPSCAFNSVPADLTTYISSKTLTAASGGPADIDTSLVAFAVSGGVSGGTIHSAMTGIEEIPTRERRMASAEYSLGPVQGTLSPRGPLIYRLFLPDTRTTLVGAFFFAKPADRALVQRTWGLLEAEAVNDKTQPHYGPMFKYDEFVVTSGPASAILMTVGFTIAFALVMLSPIRWLLKKVLPKPGEGPSEAAQKNGFMEVTNLTTGVASPASPVPIQVKTVMSGKGDPGYTLTAVMISEAALSLALAGPEALPVLGRRGGVLTPVTAFGDVYVERLAASGRITFESKVVVSSGTKRIEAKKIV
ncbi:Saccharopine dehydrogenase-domain-containing protein [Mycena crocata]|nr:Saccharopine dehydrogenase-domain-containing protein [Mycena crocata]